MWWAGNTSGDQNTKRIRIARSTLHARHAPRKRLGKVAVTETYLRSAEEIEARAIVARVGASGGGEVGKGRTRGGGEVGKRACAKKAGWC